MNESSESPCQAPDSPTAMMSPPKPLVSPSMTGYKRPCQGEMPEAPDFKKLHAAVTSLTGDFSSAFKAFPESPENPSEITKQGVVQIVS